MSEDEAMNHIGRTFIAGAIAIVPILVTLVITTWIVSTLYGYVGPESKAGQLLNSLGMLLTGSAFGGYIVGILLIGAIIFLLGLIAQSRFRPWLDGAFDSLLRRIPLVSNLYDMSKRFVAIMDRSSGDDLKSMTPVWCLFGGEAGAAVLALMPSPQPVMIGPVSYMAVLIPSAPVPFGGALIYVPKSWLKPAEGGMEKLISVYVSMGVTPPQSATTTKQIGPEQLTPSLSSDAG
jgi:uncharacterized membrane protein